MAARFNDDIYRYYLAAAVALDAAGNAYVTGRGITAIGSSEFVTIKYGLTGERRWLTRYSDFPNSSTLNTTAGGQDMALDAQSNGFVIGNASTSFGQSSLAAIKYTQSTVAPPPTGCNPLATEPRVPKATLGMAVGTPLTIFPTC